MARINKITLSLCALLFTLPYTSSSHATTHSRSTATHSKNHHGHATADKTRTVKAKASQKGKTIKVSAKKTTSGGNHSGKSKTVSNRTRTASNSSTRSRKLAIIEPNGLIWTEKCTRFKKHCTKVRVSSSDDLEMANIREVHSIRSMRYSSVHKAKVQNAQQTAMNKLMGQLGKPYRWGGSSPRTGFDCSGLVYYAYKDLVKIRIPRTANEMYHLRDAAPVDKDELKSGDLVFFRTHGRGTADHVGVYVGNGKFIQSPRTGRDIQITSLSSDYWQRHYIGARRVMTPGTIR